MMTVQGQEVDVPLSCEVVLGVVRAHGSSFISQTAFQLLTKAATAVTPAPAVKRVAPAPHKPPAKRKCAELTPKPQSQKSIFRLLDK